MAEHAEKNQLKCTKKGRAIVTGEINTNEVCAKISTASSNVDPPTSERDSLAYSDDIPNKKSRTSSPRKERIEEEEQTDFKPIIKPTERTCASCGLKLPLNATPNAQWCSDECEKHGIDDMDRALERKINELLDKRKWPSTICPSEAARALGGNDWRPLMEPARRAARRMVARSEAHITQKGVVVDPSTARGPIRIRRPPPG